MQIYEQKNNKMTHGIIIARFQPIHNGHIALIRKACNENDKVHIFIGSADKLNERNPIPIELRLEYVRAALFEADLHDNCYVSALDDLSSETDNSYEWGFYLYANIVQKIGSTKFTMYYSDGYEIITKWFPGYILRNCVSLNLLARGAVESGISSTLVRQYILNDDERLKDVVPGVIIEHKQIVKSFITVSKK